MTQADYDDALAVMRQTLAAVRAETGIEYKGFLYGQFMATADGPKLVEYNARLGDPEAMNVLSILQSDFVEALDGIAAGDVGSDVSFAKLATVCKYLVPQGYPDAPQKDKGIALSEAAMGKSGALLYYANVHEKDDALLTGTSRSIGIVGVAQTISAAERIAEAACSRVKGPLYHRRDIGTAALVQKRVEHMKKIRSG
jgi:phosphoribosylamine--glycine ligase